MKKKVAITFCVALFACALTSCSDSGNGDSGNGVKNEQPTEKEKVEALASELSDSVMFWQSRVDALMQQRDSLMKFFRQVQPTTALNPFGLDNEIKSWDISTRNAVQPRLGNSMMPWTLAVNIIGSKIGINGYSVKNNGKEVASFAISDVIAERNVPNTSGGEMFVFTADELGPLAMAVEQLPDDGCEIVLKGKNGAKTIGLQPNVVRAIRRTAAVADTHRQLWYANKNLETADIKLAYVRDRLANAGHTPQQ